jgi:hypothetical protein
MAQRFVIFETLDSTPSTSNCVICGKNPATLRSIGINEGDCCLPCACKTLADLAQWTVDHRIQKPREQVKETPRHESQLDG